MNRFISRFSLRYPRSLVYMLQASEYTVSEYLRWLKRVKDFRVVEHRKQIVWSTKATVLWYAAWLELLAWCVLVFSIAAWTQSDVPLLVALGLTALSPFALPYALLAPLGLLNLIQKPYERKIVADAKVRLSEHKGLRIGIAGSYGKTSMREILKTVLSEGKKVAAAPGSYNTPLGIAKFVETLDGDEGILIFELGEYYPGDVRALCEFVEPQWGVITGVNEAHLEKFGTLDKTAATVFELADYVETQPLYVNSENVSARGRAPQTAVLYSRDGVDDWKVTDAHTDLSGTRFMLRKGPLTVSVHSELLGMHAVGPLAAVVHIALTLGLTVAQIEEGVRRTKAFDHRLEPKTDGSGVVTLDDSYNGNPDGAAAVIDFLSSLKGRRFYVTPGLVEMGDRSEEIHRDIGKRLALAGIEQVVLIRNSVTPSIEAGLTEAGYTGTVTWFDDALDAYAALPHMTVSGDIVLLQNDWPDQYS